MLSYMMNTSTSTKRLGNGQGGPAAIQSTPAAPVAPVDKFVSYIRVSTARQGQSGLGLEAQQIAIKGYIHQRCGSHVGEVREVQSGKKGMAGRPGLIAALDRCRREKAVLILGKIDRLARDVKFFLDVLDGANGPKVDIRFADMPDVCPSTPEGRMLLINMANFAEFEGARISARTKSALAVAKKRGRVLGAKGIENLRPNIVARQGAADAFAEGLRDVVNGFKSGGASQRDLVIKLNALGIRTARGKVWSLVQVQRLLTRLNTKTEGENSPD